MIPGVDESTSRLVFAEVFLLLLQCFQENLSLTMRRPTPPTCGLRTRPECDWKNSGLPGAIQALSAAASVGHAPNSTRGIPRCLTTGCRRCDSTAFWSFEHLDLGSTPLDWYHEHSIAQPTGRGKRKPTGHMLSRWHSQSFVMNGIIMPYHAHGWMIELT